jgi:hypothetical protein
MKEKCIGDRISETRGAGRGGRVREGERDRVKEWKRGRLTCHGPPNPHDDKSKKDDEIFHRELNPKQQRGRGYGTMKEGQEIHLRRLEAAADPSSIF